MTVDWSTAERWLMGSASTDSLANEHINTLCDSIGIRWGGSEGERHAAEYIRSQFEAFGLRSASIENFQVNSWKATSANILISDETGRTIDARASLFCPSINVTARLVDVGFGMPHEIKSLNQNLEGTVALMASGYEPFTFPESLTLRLERLSKLGVLACITPHPTGGRHTAHGHASDWRDHNPNDVPLPLIHTSREDGALLIRRATAGASVTVHVDSKQIKKTSSNVIGDLKGKNWPDEWIILGAHHDTTVDSPGANDNASGCTVVLETARLLARLEQEYNISPGRSIRFATFGSEEQGLQGSTAFVKKHYGNDPIPRLMINLDELATGAMKGVALQFPQLRPLIQRELDAMNEGLTCHVMSQMDSSGDMFPFALRGIQSGMLWRWRFVGRHPDASFGHSSSDTLDKVRTRELKEYAGLLARLLLRVSHTTPNQWPEKSLDIHEIAARTASERGSAARTM